jgi:hypothetical protein
VRWLLRAVIVSAALVGIVAMHGLTLNHNTTMATMTVATATGVTDATATADNAGPTTAKSPRLVDPHTMGDMASMCVAYLAGLLLPTAAGLSLIRTIRRSDAPHRVPAPRWVAAVADRLRPDLAQLSVLRT